MDSDIAPVSVIRFVLLALILPAQGQIVPATDIPGRYCTVTDEQIRVFPSEGFTRTSLEPLTATRSVAPGNPLVPLASELSDCLFQSFDPSFDELIGPNRTLYRVGPNDTPHQWATETPIYWPDTDELIFASYQRESGSTLWRVSMSTGERTQIIPDPPIGNPGGAGLYKGQVVLGTTGDLTDDANPPGLYLIDPDTGNSSVLLNNFFGQRFNGLDDVTTLTDGTIMFTDANYTINKEHNMPSNPGQLPNNVWILPPVGPPRALITGLPNDPNGIAVTADEKTLYVGVGPITNMDPVAQAQVNEIYAFDLQVIGGGHFATNMRTFVTSDRISVDAIRVDLQGNVYGCTGDGISVWNAGGRLIGKIIIPLIPECAIAGQPATSVGFAGDHLFILRICDLLMLPINAESATDVANAATA